MASTGRVPIGSFFYSYCGCTIAQCVPCLYLLYSGLAWPARVMHVLPVFVLVTVRVLLLHSVYYACTLCTVVKHGQHGSCTYWPVYLLVLWLYHCTVCTVLVPLVQWSGMASTGNIRFTRFCTRNCACTVAQCVCACTPCTVVEHGQHGPCTYWPVFLLVPWLYH